MKMKLKLQYLILVYLSRLMGTSLIIFYLVHYLITKNIVNADEINIVNEDEINLEPVRNHVNLKAFYEESLSKETRDEIKFSILMVIGLAVYGTICILSDTSDSGITDQLF